MPPVRPPQPPARLTRGTPRPAGVWYLHCHIDWHMRAGLIATVVEAPERIRDRARRGEIVPPPSMLAACSAPRDPEGR